MNNSNEEKEIKEAAPGDVLQPKKLKPVVFLNSDFSHWRQGEFQQNLLLKAMQITQDPKELRRAIGVKTVTDVYRLLDKLSIRKEYHKVLYDKGLTIDFIVDEIKKIIEHPMTSSSVKLKSLVALMKSVGLDKYEDQADTGKNWEELLLKSEEPKMLPGKYEVVPPEVPEEEKERLEKDKKVSDGFKNVSEGLYG